MTEDGVYHIFAVFASFQPNAVGRARMVGCLVETIKTTVRCDNRGKWVDALYRFSVVVSNVGHNVYSSLSLIWPASQTVSKFGAATLQSVSTPIIWVFSLLSQIDLMLSEGSTSADANRRVRRWLREVRRSLLLLMLALVVLTIGQSDYRPTGLDIATAPYRYSIVSWELSHLSHKWTRKLADLWPWQRELSRAEQVALVQNFFDWGQQQREMEGTLRKAELGDPGTSDSEVARRDRTIAHLSLALERNRDRRKELLPEVEGIVEEELSRVLTQEGLTAGWLGVFPPVDAVFGSTPNVMALSPRDRIYREDAFLLQAGLSDAVKDELEKVALDTEDLSAVVVRTGGLSVYPSVVLDTSGLRNALEVASHEWLHHWLFFRPLGRNFGQSPEMLTLNETVASIAGEELGDLVYTSLTGEAVNRHWERINPDRFDYNAEMRETRHHAEELLAQGDIEGAEAYMEERRRLFVTNGFSIRKINQAYFAFHGSYATRPGSASPIGEQMRELRRRSGSIREFLETVSQFGSYEEYLEFLASTRLSSGPNAFRDLIVSHSEPGI